MTRRSTCGGLAAWAVVAVTLGGLAAAQGQVRDTVRPPATTTVLGDTGLWFVPTAEVAPSGDWSVSAYRVNTDRQQGLTDISHFAGAGSVGIRNRVELFGSLNVRTRIDRDVRPLSILDEPTVGGQDTEYPFVRTGFTEGVGDLSLGAKVNLLSERRRQPAAVALRGIVKMPTGSLDKGVTTGEADVLLDAVASKYLGDVEIAGFGGAIVRGDSPDADLPNGVRWGIGAGFPAPARLKVIAEVRGEAALDDVVARRPLLSEDGSVAPLRSLLRNPVDVNAGVTWQSPTGVFLGAGVGWAARYRAADSFGIPVSSGISDRVGYQVRIGFRPGRRAAVAPLFDAPVAQPGNRPPTVTANCDPCTLEPGQEAVVWADGTDPDGDALNYLWRAPAGQLAEATARSTRWTAPSSEGPVLLTVQVDDDLGGQGADSVTLNVVAPRTVELVFEDVHFEFDRYTLGAEATRVLDQAVLALQSEPTWHVTIDGRTCNIGTAEYNIALSDRRASAVRSYFISRGVDPARLTTVPYGEELAKHDNAREESRRLNRRAGLVVGLGPVAHGGGIDTRAARLVLE